MSFSSLFESGKSARNKSHYATMVRIAQSHDKISEEETKVLERFKSKLDISDTDCAAIFKNPAAYPVTPPTNSEERIQWLHDLFKIVFADHMMDDEEYKLLRRYATCLLYTSPSPRDRG